LTPNRYGPESVGVRNIMKLSFQPYKVLLKQTPYVAVALFLVQTISGIREGNKVQVVDGVRKKGGARTLDLGAWRQEQI
jgi:hypothetical protein